MAIQRSLKCRICLNNDGVLVSPENDGIKVITKLEAVIPELQWPESFHICDDCLGELDIAFNFRTKCLHSYEKISNEQSEYKSEAELKDVLEKEESDNNSDNGVNPPSPSPVTDDEQGCESEKAVYKKGSRVKKRNEIKEVLPKTTRVRTTSYICDKCEYICNSTTKLIKHCEDVHQMLTKEIRPYSCTKCDKRFKTSTNLKQHLKYHKGTRSEICSYCGKGFITKPDLFVHEKIHFNEKTYSCDQCDKSFNTHKNLGTHKLIVHTDPSLWNYVCSYCNKRFPQKSNMTAHIRRHKGEKLFECHLCQKKFCENGTLKKHILTHSNVRNNRCSECGKEYRERKVMEIHMAKVHGIGDIEIPVRIKKYICHICPKAYYDKNKLTRHLYTHTGEKPFQCTVCEKSFIDKSYLANHIRNTHSNKNISVSVPLNL